MNLQTLLEPFLTHQDVASVEIGDLQNDSRLLTQGDAFIAYPGALADGRGYIEQAIQSGANAILYEPEGYLVQESHVPLIAFPQLRDKLSALASRFYDNPSTKLSMTGVTGTNGKTTIAYQLAQAYSILGKPAAYIGTLGQGKIQALKTLANTTPDALCLQRLLHQYAQDSIQQVCMEVSSHALSLGRVDKIAFNQAIYSNLSLDHLDFHQTMTAYAEAKALLFAMPTLTHAIINKDDTYSSLMQGSIPLSCQTITYGLESNADVHPTQWASTLQGSTLAVDSPWGTYQFAIQSLGRFNIYNSLAVFSSLFASEIASVDAIVDVMKALKPSSGRLEIVQNNPCVVVDYAHTPDALENVLQTLASLRPKTLWVIFGCGGDRDRSKRPLMGKIASQYASRIIVTNDNPRSEEPDEIIKEIVKGVMTGPSLKTIPDRREAIHYALKHAQYEDVILIAGKGHEDYQIIGNQRFDFSDQAVVREFCEDLGE
jgi:UDP-N-acetylmuramoyl-L-alanyl-D-glutamate--2,6-diaminopimelate ligase